MLVPELEKAVGIEVYATRSSGIGGIIRQNVEDFAVEEVLVDGSKAEITPSKKSTNHTVLGSSWNKNRYLLCVLVKRDWDTFIAIRNIANQLGISPRQIHTAGIKDAKAITAQHIAIEGVSAEDAQKVHVKDIEVRPVGYLQIKLSSYYLLGNNFHIRINALNHPRPTIRKRIAKTIEELETVCGMPNFFGHQRFGTTRPITHLVGKAIVQGDFEKAAMLFLAEPSKHEHPASRKARGELQETLNFKQSLENYPKQLRYERMMLEQLVEKPKDFAGAFKRLPIKLRELFIQAYQSYLFNKFLSGRILKGFPLNVAEVGDYAVNVERSGLPMPTMYRMVNLGTRAEINSLIKRGKMRLAIPLVGFRQHLSQGVQGEIEKQIFEREDISLESFRISAMPEMSARGELRAALTPVNNFSLETVSSDPADSKKCSAKVSFSLNRSSYATILLREIMKPRNVTKAGF